MSINLKTTSAMESQIDKALKKMKSMTVTTREDYVMEALKYFTGTEGLAGSAKYIAYAPFRISSLDIIAANEPLHIDMLINFIEFQDGMDECIEITNKLSEFFPNKNFRFEELL